MAVVIHVEQATLVRIGFCSAGKIKGQIDRIQHRSAVQLQGVKCPGFDQGFYGSFVDLATLHPNAKIKQAGKRTARFTCRHNRFHRLLSRTFDCA